MNIVKIILPLTAIFSWNIQQYNVKNVFLHGDLINGGIFISQRKYVADLLKDTEKSACKPTSTPLNPNHKLSVHEGEYIDCEMYQQLIGRLLYLTHTRHEISYPTKYHLHVVYQVLHYLKGTPRKGILFKCGGNLTIEMYIDANYFYCDNKSAINLVHNPIQHDHTKQVEIDHHFTKENLESK
ncbi:unnamed protein product [Spirodela intermedia]|uniref:Uncharacterized protein n=1 Tax=Spirodela intermedia TaxID=51605 RepID=A0A7I8KUC6_SPIIN|nr:unnamed protein product [Spirodela intermedia]